MSGNSGFFANISRGLKRLASKFKEKQPAQLEDFVLEHFMMYHGLVGSSPENQPQFRDVRADIIQAVNHGSSVQLGIVLKLPPLWWEDKFAKIVEDLQDKRAALISCLLPSGDEDDILPDADPLRHQNWQVRANAAKLLAMLKAEEGAEKLAKALHATTGDTKPAFCHIAYSLAALQHPIGKAALREHLSHEEPWFRVDAAGALAHWPLEKSANQLMSAMLDTHALSDYMAVAIAKKHKPKDFLNQSDETVREGALEMILGLLQAAQGTFGTDAVFDAEADKCVAEVLSLAQSKPTPRRVNAAQRLVTWLEEHGDVDQNLIRQWKEQTGKLLSDVRTRLSDWLSKAAESHDPETRGQIKHALKLAADVGDAALTPHLVPLIRPDFYGLPELLEALKATGPREAESKIHELIQDVINLQERINQPASTHPVFEENAEKARIYWLALRALSNYPSPETAQLLIKATNDFAPDKRSEALSSLIVVAQDTAVFDSLRAQITSAIASGLADPSVQMRTVALEGVSSLRLAELTSEVVKTCGAREVSLSRQAFATLKLLSAAGHKQEVISAARSKTASSLEPSRRQRLQDFVSEIQ